MEQTKVSRKQVALFFNGENENRSFIAKQWLIKQILFEKKYCYGDFYFIYICNEDNCPDDKFGICRSVLVSEMICIVCRQEQGIEAFFAFLRQAPDWQELLSEILCHPMVENNLEMVRIILRELCCSSVDENLLRQVVSLLINNRELWQQDDEIAEVPLKLLQSFVNCGGKLKRKEFLARGAFHYLGLNMAYDFEYLALSGGIFPEERGSAASDIYNICQLARLLKKEKETLVLFRQVILGCDADVVCHELMTFRQEFMPEVLEIIALRPPLFWNDAILFLKRLRNISHSGIPSGLKAEIVDKIAKQTKFVSEKFIIEIAETNFESVEYLDFSSEKEGEFSPNIISLYNLLDGPAAETAEKIIARRKLQNLIVKYKEKEREADWLAEQILNNNVVCD